MVVSHSQRDRERHGRQAELLDGVDGVHGASDLHSAPVRGARTRRLNVWGSAEGGVEATLTERFINNLAASLNCKCSVEEPRESSDEATGRVAA